MILQVHYVNAVTQTTKNHKGKVSVNIWKTKAPQNKIATSSMMFARNRTIDVPPNSEVSFAKDCKFLPIPRPMYILGMTGHFHGRGKRFVVDKMGYDANFNPIVLEEKIYESNDWSEPPFTPYSTPIKLNTNEYIRYTCYYVNNSDKRFKFGPKVETDEHANLFVWFVPSWQNGKTWYDDAQ